MTELPKTISGKIRRVQLRAQETTLRGSGSTARNRHEYFEEDFVPSTGSASAPAEH